MNKKYELREEYKQESTAVLAGLIGISVVIVQALIGSRSGDLPAMISILAFAISLPMLGILVIINALYARYRYASFPTYLTIAYVIGEAGAAVGVIAAFWHLSWVAGVLIMVSGMFGMAVYLAYTRQIQKDNLPVEQENGH